MHTNKELLVLPTSKTSSIASLKRAIAERTHIADECQCLMADGIILCDFLLVCDCQLEDGAIVELSIIEREEDLMQIEVNLPGGSILPLFVLPTDIVATVKAHCLTVIGNVVRTHQLFLSNSQEMDDVLQLADYGVAEGCVLYLLPIVKDQSIKQADGLITVHFLSRSSVRTRRVKPSARLRDVLQQLDNMGEIKDIAQFCVRFNGKHMLNSKTLDECGIHDNESVFLCLLKSAEKKEVGS